MKRLLREDIEVREHEILSSDAAYSDATEGRVSSGQPDQLRTEFQRDRDKIIHCKSFRRLSHKTQVFIAPVGDHYRTRLTHTLEVAQISRTVARGLGLNEDLVEAIALGHDLGHTPFGHIGEEAISDMIASLREGEEGLRFSHNEQSLRVVEVLENDGRGLNLTAEVRDGIRCHTGAQRAETLEGRVVAIADRIAYVNHDIDDAIRAGILDEGDLPAVIHEVLGDDHSARIETLVQDLVATSERTGDIALSDEVFNAVTQLRAFLFDNVYRSDLVMAEVRKAYHLVQDLFGYYLRHVDRVPPEYLKTSGGDDLVAVCDYVAGMTDRYATSLFEELFVPHDTISGPLPD